MPSISLHSFQCDHDPLLVVLSFTISVFGAYCSLRLASQIPGAPKGGVWGWLAGAAVAMGGGAIWSMHFIAMMACRLLVPVEYDEWTTMASLLVAIVVTGVGLLVVGRGTKNVRRLIAGGTFTGLGVAAMHYTGMAAMRLPADIRYRPGLVWASVGIAVVAATAALWLAFNLDAAWQRLAASLVMGIAVCGMHYTGMAAAVFTPHPATRDHVVSSAFSPSDLGFMVFGVTLFLLVLLSVGSGVAESQRRQSELVRIQAELERQVSDRTSELARANQDLRVGIEERERDHAERARLTAFAADVGSALTKAESLERALNLSAEAMVRHLGGAMASIWRIDKREAVLDLVGTAWARRPLFGPDARVPLGDFRVGQIAVERKPMIRDLTAEPEREDDRDWAHREGMTSYAGYPLVVADQVVGVMAMFSMRPITPLVLDAMASIADGIALGIDRANGAEALRVSEASNRAVIENMLTGLITTDERSIIESFNPAAEKVFGFASSEIVGQSLVTLLPAEAARDAAAYLRDAKNKAMGRLTEWPARRKDGSIFTMELALFEFRTPDGRRHFAGSVRDVSAAREIERLKSEFVSTVSHELRTPLTSIRGALGLVNGGVVGEIPARAQSLLDIAYKNTERLSRLVNDILDLEKIESGRMEFQLDRLDLRPVVEAVVESNQAYAAAYRVRLVLAGEPGEAWVRADRDRFAQVLTNLISNAVKFSPEGERVSVSVSCDEVRGRIRVSVSDRGAGIPEEFRDRIFQRFQQADSSDTRQKGGTGLGLAITKSIVERLGGEISFESRANAGTSFHVDLPEAWNPEPVPAAADLPALSTDRLRILVCEDDYDQASLLSVILQDAGCQTEVARDAAEAKALLALRHFDAMTLDIVLPGQDGISLIQELKQDERTRSLPIIVVCLDPETSRARLTGDAFGIVDWLGKPVDTTRLLGAIDRAATGSARASRPRILHVEDDPDVLTLLASLLESRAEVVGVRTCREAQKALGEGEFELLVLDLELPDGSGLDLLPLLNRPGRRPTPVMVFSAHELSRSVAQEIEARLTKSHTSNDEILRTIESLVRLPRRGAA